MENNSITISDVEYLAQMSGLEFTDEEKMIMRDQVAGILEMLDGCAEAENECDLNQMTLSLSDLRDDEVVESVVTDVLMNAPKSHKGYYVVPKVVE